MQSIRVWHPAIPADLGHLVLNNLLDMSIINPETQRFYENQIARLQARNAELEASHLVETRALDTHFINRLRQLDDERRIAADAAAQENATLASVNAALEVETNELRVQMEKLNREMDMEREV